MSSLSEWLRQENVLVIVIGVMLGDAVSKLLGRFSETVLTPLMRSIFHEDPHDPAYVRIGPAQLQVRLLSMALLEFLLIAAVAYVLFKKLQKKDAQIAAKTKSKTVRPKAKATSRESVK